eukprot:scaffold2859_cov349-Pavlova_lutheri.AAC.82
MDETVVPKRWRGSDRDDGDPAGGCLAQRAWASLSFLSCGAPSFRPWGCIRKFIPPSCESGWSDVDGCSC